MEILAGILRQPPYPPLAWDAFDDAELFQRLLIPADLPFDGAAQCACVPDRRAGIQVRLVNLGALRYKTVERSVFESATRRFSIRCPNVGE